MKRLLSTLLLLSLSSVGVISQSRGTPSTLVVKVDANGFLLVTSATQTNPITQGTFATRNLRTDASGSLQVVLTGTVTPTYPLAIPASTCAAPSLGLSGGATTGIAFTATPSILDCVSGTAVLTLTGSSYTSTVPVLGPDGSASAPGLGFSSQSNTGLFLAGTNDPRVTVNGIASLRINLTALTIPGGSTYSWANGTIGNSPDLHLTREAAATLQLGLDAAGVTNQMFKSSDRITSDGVGADLIIAGGRNRGASNGGSIILQTSSPAGAGVTGTLATRLSVDTNGQLIGALGTITTDLKLKDDTVTWNNAGVTFTGWKLNVTDTNSAAASLLLDIQLGGTSRLSLRKDGTLVLANSSITAVGVVVSSGAAFQLATPVMTRTAPTISSGFGTSPSIVASNGTAAFTVNVGTGGTASSGVITMPAATTGWNCSVENRTGVLANVANQRTIQIATTTTSVTLENQTISTGAVLAWTASDVLAVMCLGY